MTCAIAQKIVLEGSNNNIRSERDPTFICRETMESQKKFMFQNVKYKLKKISIDI